jgi:hypothetical protein
MKNQNNNNEWEDDRITEDGEDITVRTKRLLEHKVDRKELTGWCLSMLGLCAGLIYFQLNAFFNIRFQYIEKLVEKQEVVIKEQNDRIEKQNDKLEKQNDKITNKLVEIERLKK